LDKTNELIKFLLNSASYPDPTSMVTLLQTHISWVFVTDHFAYKIKKPVNFGFLDFSTLEKRKLNCEREIKLNRRLAPDIYLGLIKFTYDGNQFFFDGNGETIEYGVKMKRLKQERMMDQLIKQNALTYDMIDAVAKKVADFHKKAETNKKINSFGSLDVIWFNWEENFYQTRDFIGFTLTKHRHSYIMEHIRNFITKNRTLFEKRIEERRIRDCHGDLHSRNICFDKNVVIYDCIEFNERFRYMDVASEVAFLAMDLDFHNLPEFSNRFVDQYIKESNDPSLKLLLDFYKCYRAYVRGKVLGFLVNMENVPIDERKENLLNARRYLSLAYKYAGGKEKPKLIVISGLMGSGKTFLAEAISEKFGIPIISTDKVRKEMLGIDIYEHHFEDFGKGIYSEEKSDMVYETIRDKALSILFAGGSLILDGSFSKSKYRKMMMDIANSTDANFLLIETKAPESIIKKRLKKRLETDKTVTDGRWELFHEQKKNFEPFAEIPESKHIVIDTSNSKEEMISKIVDFKELFSDKNISLDNIIDKHL